MQDAGLKNCTNSGPTWTKTIKFTYISTFNFQLSTLNSLPMQPPKKWKMMLITWLFVYPVINILFLTVFPFVKDAHQLVKTLVLTLILVPLLGFFVPKLHKKFEAWMRK